MTNEQIENARLVLAVNSIEAISSWDGKKRFFNDGEIISFTNARMYTTNATFEINKDPNWEVWFSQLDMMFLHKTLDPACFLIWGIIKFLDGEIKHIYDYNAAQFYDLVVGKTFKVQINPDTFGAINVKSDVIKKLPGNTFGDIYNYVVNCVEKGHPREIGDLIKTTAKLYNFIEIP